MILLDNFLVCQNRCHCCFKFFSSIRIAGNYLFGIHPEFHLGYSILFIYFLKSLYMDSVMGIWILILSLIKFMNLYMVLAWFNSCLFVSFWFEVILSCLRSLSLSRRREYSVYSVSHVECEKQKFIPIFYTLFMYFDLGSAPSDVVVFSFIWGSYYY